MGELECLCCPTRSKSTGGSGGRIANTRGVCTTCDSWLRHRRKAGKDTEARQIERGLIRKKKRHDGSSFNGSKPCRA